MSDHRLSCQEYAEMLGKQAEINRSREQEEEAKAETFFEGSRWLGGIPGTFGGIGLQGLMQQAAQDQARHEETLRKRPSGHHVAIPADQQLTRLDISTGERVPVTQEWINEAVAEIFRLNVELTANMAVKVAKGRGAEVHPRIAALKDALETDRIWEAVRAASAV